MCGAIACTRGGTYAPPARVHLVHAHTRAETCARTYPRVYVRARVRVQLLMSFLFLCRPHFVRLSGSGSLSLTLRLLARSRSLASRFVCESVCIPASQRTPSHLHT
ncbi:expressed protein [Echinococcus multilocularis]|uniref:Expressed protein n=1 Tax=Echinococcus multilocularis TaxID=6211 RepID=A0A087W1F5_ECHMU|nr:expressed protein [Echinococcus multilocularis]